ncbi:MAG: phosphatase PAP2 family protein [Fimbriimonadales bacterium]|nr:MAG: phosphatase PAP2 family protein [Fimbriimonadales bacterium]
MDTLLYYDRELFFALNHGLNHPLLDPMMWLITSLGLGWVQLVVVLSATLIMEQRRRLQGFRTTTQASAWRVIFSPALVAFVGSGLTVQLLKRTLPRLRPSNLPDALVASDERIFHNSFPSGHTATAFALAFWLFMLTRRTRYRWWGYGALLLAGLVGLSRIYRGVHYPSDVLAGALVGVLWGAIAYFTLNASRAHVPPAAESLRDSGQASPHD